MTDPGAALPPHPADTPQQVSIQAQSDEAGLQIIDPIERRRYAVGTASPVTPTPAPPAQVRFPVDTAVAITTDAITLPSIEAVYVRDAAGTMLTEAEYFAYEELPDAAYSIEVCAPIKLYVHVEGPLTLQSDMERFQLDFGTTTEVVVGARSHHDRPAATITTTTDPADMMTAVSHFGSALKTTSPERSYPSLRGHPPTVELGETLAIPDGVAPPETGLRIEIPPTYRAIFVTAPLAYYLGAELVEGETPRLVTDTGFEYALASPQGFEAAVEQVLKQVFFLDCLTRTEGYYQVDLHERTAVERDLALDLEFAALYEASLATQLEAYLDVPFAVLEPYLPEWKLTTHVQPNAASIETLPFVVDDLAVVRTPDPDPVAGSPVEQAAVGEFTRAEEFTRSTSDSAPVDPSYIAPAAASSLEQTWIGEGTPVGANKATTEAFEHHLARTPTADAIDITVVCNDAAMRDEQAVIEDEYGARDELPFEITFEEGLTTAGLREVLASESDFLHYIGHIDAAGFQCTDGTLDASSLETVGIDAFFLNACQSYAQGMELIEAGSIGGVVTLNDIINSGAIRIGSAMARLLNSGFSLQAALTIAQERSIIGDQYLVVGDSGVAIAHSEAGTPIMFEVTPADEGFTVAMNMYPTAERGMGSMVKPGFETMDAHFLSSSSTSEFTVSAAELERVLSLEQLPVKIDGELQWSTELDLSEFC